MSNDVDFPAAAATDKRDVILAAATEAFARYGYRRTAMEDVADLAGVSRPLLYTRFRNKADLFAAVAQRLVDTALRDAETAWPPGAPVEDGLRAAALAKGLPLFRLLRDSPHGAELIAQAKDAAAGIQHDITARFADLIAARLAGHPDARTLAAMAAHAINGMKAGADSEAQFEREVRAFARAFAAITR
ncbi:MAG: helix-turn-helix domain-containing protein [Hyphomonadaceae bacterium]|nr:helix-turn-helix domain-containing protein [Hyphomonadaceae bacterium]